MDSYLVIDIKANLGFAAIFAFLGLGFLFLRSVDREEGAIGSWALGFGLNGLGFLFWSLVFPLPRWLQYLVGEFLHILGFLAMVLGAYRFFGRRIGLRERIALLAFALAWLLCLGLTRIQPAWSVFGLRLLRSILFAFAGTWILIQDPGRRLAGKKLAGASMLAWGAYILLTAVWRFIDSTDLQFGILAGFHILAAFGMVAMVMDRLRLAAEESESRLRRLEGLLPICSYCKKIRDKEDAWHVLELYIEDHSAAEFSHGICPDCLEKHHPHL
jgi:hypothetical protein